MITFKISIFAAFWLVVIEPVCGVRTSILTRSLRGVLRPSITDVETDLDLPTSGDALEEASDEEDFDGLHDEERLKLFDRAWAHADSELREEASRRPQVGDWVLIRAHEKARTSFHENCIAVVERTYFGKYYMRIISQATGMPMYGFNNGDFHEFVTSSDEFTFAKTSVQDLILINHVRDDAKKIWQERTLAGAAVTFKQLTDADVSAGHAQFVAAKERLKAAFASIGNQSWSKLISKHILFRWLVKSRSVEVPVNHGNILDLEGDSNLVVSVHDGDRLVWQKKPKNPHVHAESRIPEHNPTCQMTLGARHTTRLTFRLRRPLPEVNAFEEIQSEWFRQAYIDNEVYMRKRDMPTGLVVQDPVPKKIARRQKTIRVAAAMGLVGSVVGLAAGVLALRHLVTELGN